MTDDEIWRLINLRIGRKGRFFDLCVVTVGAVENDERFSKQLDDRSKPRSRNMICGAKLDDGMYIAHSIYSSHLRYVL